MKLTDFQLLKNSLQRFLQVAFDAEEKKIEDVATVEMLAFQTCNMMTNWMITVIDRHTFKSVLFELLANCVSPIALTSQNVQSIFERASRSAVTKPIDLDELEDRALESLAMLRRQINDIEYTKLQHIGPIEKTKINELANTYYRGRIAEIAVALKSSLANSVGQVTIRVLEDIVAYYVSQAVTTALTSI